MKYSGAEILIKSLIEQDVDVIFGYPGGSVIEIYDALFVYRDKIRHVLTSHEQGAAHAADGYARTKGKTGVTVATSGPGATNLITGLATAFLDSIPMVAITGNVASKMYGTDSFQEIDITGVTMPITKYNFVINSAEEIPEVVKRAFVIANSGRPGPVLIDIPKDVTIQKAEFTSAGKFQRRDNPQPEPDMLEQAIEIINSAQKPFICFGGGAKVSHAEEAIIRFADRIDSPIASTTMGLAAIGYDCPRYLGLVGMHGRTVCNKAIAETDLLINIGARFSDRIVGDKGKFARSAKIIQIDIESAELGKNVSIDIPLQGDATEIVEALTKSVKQKDCAGWTEHLKSFVAGNGALPEYEGTLVDPIKLIERVPEIVGKNTIIATDVGQHQMLVAYNYKFAKGNQFISSCGLGTMGFGLGAANGAQVGSPDKQVVLFTGDGCFHMNLNELAVAVTERLPILILIFNNSVLGMVRQWQKLFYDEKYSATELERKTDFVKLAEAFGAFGFRLTNNDDIDEVIGRAFSKANEERLPVVVDCVIDRDFGAFPFIPAGKAFEDTIHVYKN